MKRKTTNRGFGYVEFKDQKGIECSIQKSSSAMEECIWLGADKIGMKVFIAGSGWQSMGHLDNDGLHIANNRMHLTRKQVEKLIPILQKFVDTGDV